MSLAERSYHRCGQIHFCRDLSPNIEIRNRQWCQIWKIRGMREQFSAQYDYACAPLRCLF